MSGGYRNPEADGSTLTAAELLWVQTGSAGVVLLTEQGSDPVATAGKGKLYVKTDNHLYYMDEAGVITQIDVGGSVTFVTPTGTVNGVNATFGVASSPKCVIGDGITYFLGLGYSYSAPNITMDVPPSQYIRAIL